MQTPHRFRSKRQLWTYSGLGIESRDSAQYRYVHGQLRRTTKPQQIRGLNQNHNHEMKKIFKGAATRASCGLGPLRNFYVTLLAKGMKPETRNFLKPIADYVSNCQSKWIGDWTVSIFTEPRFAVYKTESENQNSSDPLQWADSYMGEYNSATRSYSCTRSLPRTRNGSRLRRLRDETLLATGVIRWDEKAGL